MSALLFGVLLTLLGSLNIIHCYPGEIIYSCYNDFPQIHLSFDDAVTFPQTDNILDLLQEFNITATFYVLTSLITPENYDETKRVIERMKNEGHLIGNHGHNHYNLIHLNETAIKYEIDTSTEILTELIGYQPIVFRPPYGGVNEFIKDYSKQNGYTIVLWDVGNVDWYYDDSILSNQAYCSMVPSMGGIFVFHNDYQGANNANGLRQLIQILNHDYAYENFTVPFEVPNDPYFPYVSFLECINRKHINDIPYYYIVKGDNKMEKKTRNVLIGSMVVLVIVAFVFGYWIRSRYLLCTKIGLMVSCGNACCKGRKGYDEMRPLTTL
eukprot:220332_1